MFWKIFLKVLCGKNSNKSINSDILQRCLGCAEKDNKNMKKIMVMISLLFVGCSSSNLDLSGIWEAVETKEAGESSHPAAKYKVQISDLNEVLEIRNCYGVGISEFNKSGDEYISVDGVSKLSVLSDNKLLRISNDTETTYSKNQDVGYFEAGKIEIENSEINIKVDNEICVNRFAFEGEKRVLFSLKAVHEGNKISILIHLINPIIGHIEFDRFDRYDQEGDFNDVNYFTVYSEPSVLYVPGHLIFLRGKVEIVEYDNDSLNLKFDITNNELVNLTGLIDVDI